MATTRPGKGPFRPGATAEWLLRANQAVRRVAQRFSLRQDAFFSGLITELCPPGQRGAITGLLYDESGEYRGGGAVFEAGLFPWEAGVIDGEGSAFPRGGAILVGGVGGGRLIRPLRGRGYRVLGFDPSRLLAHAREVAAGDDGVRLAAGGYQDLGAAVRGRGPLADLFGGEAVDGVVLAFGSMTHLSPAERRELFAALRALAPRAPVFLSFVLGRGESEFSRHAGRARSLGRALRGPFGRGGGDDGARFVPGVGFVYLPSREEIAALCEGAGYELTAYAEAPYGRALAVPWPDGRPKPAEAPHTFGLRRLVWGRSDFVDGSTHRRQGWQEAPKGWSMAASLETTFCLDALGMALRARKPSPGLVHHSDRGRQCASAAYRKALEAGGPVCSMSRQGNGWCNAVAERFFAALKGDLVDRADFATRAEARAAIFEYVEVFYNRQRRHSHLGYQAPAEFEETIDSSIKKAA